MGGKSSIHIHHHKPSETYTEEQIIEQIAQYYLPASYPIVQLACFHFPSLHNDVQGSICGRISASGTTPLRFRFNASSQHVLLEPISSGQAAGPCAHAVAPSSYHTKALAFFLLPALSDIIAHTASELERTQNNERLQKIQQKLCEQMFRQIAEQQQRWMIARAEERDAIRHREKRDREREEIKKEEVRKQEERLSIQKVEEPRRQSQRLATAKEEAVNSGLKTRE